MIYLYVKSFHIIFVITWFAGLFYVVRLFIYHTESLAMNEPKKSIISSQLSIMTKRLWYVIAWPSAILTFIFGLALLVLQPTWLDESFMHVKLSFVFFLYLYHFGCHRIYQYLQDGIVKYSPTWLRIFNELLTFILFAIVFLIVLKSEVDWVWGILGMAGLAIVLMIGIKGYKRLRKKT